MLSYDELDEDVIVHFLRQGRGTGVGKHYKPWLTIQEASPDCDARCIEGNVTGRLHHLLSPMERVAFLEYDAISGVKDIREHFPLNRDETRWIAKNAGIEHPTYEDGIIEAVMTTDFLIDIGDGATAKTLARAVRPLQALSPLTSIVEIASLEIQRLYWEARDVHWRIVTENDFEHYWK